MLLPFCARLLTAMLCLVFCVLDSRVFAQGRRVEDIAFVDDSHGWLLVDEPPNTIFRTVDGGQTWTEIPIPFKNSFYRLHFFDANTGIAIQFESEKTTAIYRTTDAGQTWAKINSMEAKYGEHIVDLTLTSPEDSFLVGEGTMGRGFVAQLSNGGRTLRVREDLPADFTQQSNALGVFGDGFGHLWIVGKELILHSADSGTTWENQYANAIPRIDMGVAGAALPGGHAWIAVANFEIYRTEDYGKHWTRALTTEDQGAINFQSISFFDARRGCAVGNSSFIYCTNDGGVTWSRNKAFENFQKGAPFFSKLLVFSSLRGWASVNGGLFKTEDGGQSFREVLTSSGPTKSEVLGESLALQTSINGPSELTYDSDGFLYIVESIQGRLLRLDIEHKSIKVTLPEPEDGIYRDFDEPNAIAADQRGNLFIADFNGRLRKLSVRAGTVTVLLPAPKEVSKTIFEVPAAMAIDKQGNPLIVDRHHKLSRWNLKLAKPETVAGSGAAGFGGDGALATNALLHFPEGVAIDGAGDIFVADYQNCRIRKIQNKTNIITTVAGTGECASKGDGGLATNAALDYPSSIAVDGNGNLFIVDGNRVRQIDARGAITTYAGTGQPGFGGDGGPADKAMLNNPSGLAVDPRGNLYISEYVNNRIRFVDATSHIISTVAGDGNPKRIDVVM
jgi:photosystem II stability/assembly factor-like uncharacterized protein/sugar lactone lactonase YvrE